MISASVIIPTHNRASMLRQTLISLCEQNMDINSYEIIIVDNASTDETKKVVEDFKDRNLEIRYIYEPNMGLHNARHMGASAARGNILLYVDDDVIVDKNLLREILKMYSDPDVGCVGGKILPKWEIEIPDWIERFPKWYLSILDDEDGPKEVQWIFGCNFSIQKKLLYEVGGFNPDAFGDKKMWWYRGDGEIGLLKKVHHLGRKVVYNPKAVVWHFIPQNRLTFEYFKERAFKSGVEASFSKYRYGNSLHPLLLLFRAAIFSLFWCAHVILALPKGSVLHQTRACYYRARFLYELRLGRDNNLRKFVKKDNWLE